MIKLFSRINKMAQVKNNRKLMKTSVVFLFYGHKKKQLLDCNCLIFGVVAPGIEPGTQGFSVLCSTN